jgi:hypothetical protein
LTSEHIWQTYYEEFTLLVWISTIFSQLQCTVDNFRKKNDILILPDKIIRCNYVAETQILL